MAQDDQPQSPDDQFEIDLRNPWIAAFWAWILPGAGHFYQGRFAKGVLFMVCILGTYFFGLTLGGGHVVYASWEPNDHRWQYAFQVCVGAPALPAIVQSQRVKRGMEPLFGGIMAPPERPVRPNEWDQLAEWHEEYPLGFELGTLYTMVAGLLNILAIYDAFAGPVVAVAGQEKDKPPPDKKSKPDKK